jgi:hypothetical protein
MGRRLADAVYLIDSTGIRLSSLSAEWAQFCAGVSGAKLHIVYNASGKLVAADRNDAQAAANIAHPTGIYAVCSRNFIISPPSPAAVHLILMPFNIFRLREMLRLTKQVRVAAQSNLEMDWLKPFTSSRRMRAGELLFRKGDVANEIYFIISGRCRVSALGIDVLPGHVVGELALLTPDQMRTQSVECTEDGEALQITYEQVKQLYYQNPRFGFYFLQLTTRRLFQDIARLENALAT